MAVHTGRPSYRDITSDLPRSAGQTRFGRPLANLSRASPWLLLCGGRQSAEREMGIHNGNCRLYTSSILLEEEHSDVATLKKNNTPREKNARNVGERRETVGFRGAESFSWGSDPGNSGVAHPWRHKAPRNFKNSLNRRTRQYADSELKEWESWSDMDMLWSSSQRSSLPSMAG